MTSESRADARAPRQARDTYCFVAVGPARGWLLCWLLLLIVAGFCGSVRAEQGTGMTISNLDLSMSDLLQRVLKRNETLQGRLLSFEAQRRRSKGEYGIFEPDLFGNYTHEVNNRKNTAEQAASLFNQPRFTETNNNYEAGIETLVPAGTRVKLGYTVRDLNNSLQPIRGATNGEWQTFFGVTLTQPLLKNFGTAVTMAGIRLSAISNKMAFQEYRRDLMTVVSSAEATYWNLYLAQEQVRFFEESVKTAETILRDNRTRLQAGKGSELEVLEAEAGVGLRQAKLAEARQKVVEAVNRVISLYAERASMGGPTVRVVDVPQIAGEVPAYETLGRTAFELNPDFLVAEERLQQDLIRLGVARNQRLPEFNLKGSYGLNGLGDTPKASWIDVEQATEPSWYAGAELHIPLGGGIKSRADLSAARLEFQASELVLHGLQTEILNGLNTAWNKIYSTRGSVTNYQSAVRYNQNVLEAALTRLDAGKIESRKVLEIEGDLLESRVSVVESLVHYELAMLELEIIQGVLLQHRRLEITQGQLEVATRSLGHSRSLRDPAFQQALDDVARVRQDAEIGVAGKEPSEDTRLRQNLRDAETQREIKQGAEEGYPKFGPQRPPTPTGLELELRHRLLEEKRQEEQTNPTK